MQPYRRDVAKIDSFSNEKKYTDYLAAKKINSYLPPAWECSTVNCPQFGPVDAQVFKVLPSGTTTSNVTLDFEVYQKEWKSVSHLKDIWPYGVTYLDRKVKTSGNNADVWMKLSQDYTQGIAVNLHWLNLQVKSGNTKMVNEQDSVSTQFETCTIKYPISWETIENNPNVMVFNSQQDFKENLLRFLLQCKPQSTDDWN